jgi:plastocyanin
MTPRTITLILLVTSACIGCESNRVTESVLPGINRPRPDPSVLTTLEVLPSTVTLEQGFTVQLGIVARDQRGARMADAGGVTFTSSDSAIAKVSSSGFVTAVAAGTADILVTKTVAGVTRSAAMKATILPATPLANVVLTADLKRGWQPSVAHLIVGGTVQWVTAGPLSWSEVPHRMLYLLDTEYSVMDSLDLSTGSTTRKFETAGEYRYCSAGCWDPPDFGVVYVH